MNLLEGLIQRGHRVKVVVPKDQVCNVPGASCIAVQPTRLDLTPGRWFSLGVKFAGVLRDIQREFDIVHFTDAREAWRVGRPCRPVTGMANDAYALDWTDPKYPRSTYSDRLSRGLYYGFLRKMEGNAYPRLDALIANSGHVCRTITKGYHLDAAKVCVIHYGLRQQNQDHPLPLTGSPAVLFVGGNFLRKGLPLLLQAAAVLKPKFPEIHLHVVGKDPNQPTIAALAARLNCTRSVTFHGRQPNDIVRRMMAGAAIFALPSITEGFGLVYLEAMQAGTPVIATRAGGASEVFLDNSEAVFVDPLNVGEITGAIEKTASDNNFARTLREGGRRAVSRFTVESMVAQTERLWGSLLSK
jgi:glycosyltransferase involved in cell wall biosynthesis